MKKIDLVATIQVLANVGVIAGIVFLGVELSQNNDLLEYEKRRSALDLSLTQQDMVLENPDARRAFARITIGESALTQAAEDEGLFAAMLTKLILTYQWQYLELPETRDRIRYVLEHSGKVKSEERIWTGLRPTLNPEFVAFFEDARGFE